MRNTANEEVKSKVLEEWDIWAPKNLPAGHKANGVDGLRFYSYLQEERPQIFIKFRSGRVRSDPWQTMRRWLVIAKKISTD